MRQQDNPKKIPEPHSLDEWAQVLCNEEMPIFSNTALMIDNILNDDKKGAMELASVILQDPNLTFKLLKISNTPHYNPTRQKIVTVSQAIILIGSEVIRQLTLVCAFFEAIQSAINKQQACEEIARAVHSAIHARSIAIKTNDISPEEVFIAALLNHIGHISFWCFCGEQGERIQALFNTGNHSREEAEKQVLGFKLSELGICLSKVWKLGGLIEESIKSNAWGKNPRVNLVHLGYEITEALTESADSKKYDACIRKIEGLTKLSRKNIIEQLNNNNITAADIAKQFGATAAAVFIQKNQSKSVYTEDYSPTIDKKQLRLQIAQVIMSIMSERLDINLLLETVLEGIYRGIGMDRVILAMVGADKQTVVEKLSFGWNKDIHAQKIVFKISETPSNLFFHALSGAQAFWAKPQVNTTLYTPHVINIVGKNECFMMPIFFKQKPIGLIYADCVSAQALTEEDFNAFKYFAQHVNIGLHYMMDANKPPFAENPGNAATAK